MVKTPVISVVLGGDKYTLAKVGAAVQDGIVVVIVDGSGEVANFLSELLIKLEKMKKRSEITKFITLLIVKLPSTRSCNCNLAKYLYLAPCT